MATVFLGLGSNLGNRKKNIDRAIQELESLDIAIEDISTIIETEPVGGPPQNKFLNGVIKTFSNLSPKELLVTVKDIEKRMGRVTTVLNGPRPIDIDILLYDNIKIQTSELTIPHPRMMERDFVMTPLREIEPEIDKLFP